MLTFVLGCLLRLGARDARGAELGAQRRLLDDGLQDLGVVLKSVVVSFELDSLDFADLEEGNSIAVLLVDVLEVV